MGGEGWQNHSGQNDVERRDGGMIWAKRWELVSHHSATSSFCQLIVLPLTLSIRQRFEFEDGLIDCQRVADAGRDF